MNSSSDNNSQNTGISNKIWVYDSSNHWVCLEDKSLPVVETSGPKKDESINLDQSPPNIENQSPEKLELTEEEKKKESAEKIKETYTLIEKYDIPIRRNNYVHETLGIVSAIKINSEEATVITVDESKTVPISELRGSAEVTLNVHSGSGTFEFSFKADLNYQSKNFFTNILRTHLESKFNFATFETFIGENNVKVSDMKEIMNQWTDFETERNKKFLKKCEERDVRKNEHYEKLENEIKQFIEEFNAKNNIPQEKKEPKEEEKKNEDKKEEEKNDENKKTDETKTEENLNVEEKEKESAGVISEIKEPEKTEELSEEQKEKISELIKERDAKCQEMRKEKAFSEPSPEEPYAFLRAKLFDTKSYSICEEEKTITIHSDSPILKLPNLENTPENIKLKFEVVLAPLQSLQVCQLFEKILYQRNTCPKSSFSPSEPILFHGFSLYGPFPNNDSPSAFKMTFKVGNSRTNEVQIIRANVFDQKEKFHKFFLNQPMYVDQKDFVNIISIQNSKDLSKFELGISKELYDSKYFKLQAYDEF
jgi:hypothetical protein